ncbi:hypothetical protein GCM10022402_25500 [Salinactinospora qingdaonensis]|uniref:Uncharacterized protein n=1 Tax=Salinactinospora qingdaonensis TaxID=702744 RepID=A0ABP7FQM4_9ACTN
MQFPKLLLDGAALLVDALRTGTDVGGHLGMGVVEHLQLGQQPLPSGVQIVKAALQRSQAGLVFAVGLGLDLGQPGGQPAPCGWG